MAKKGNETGIQVKATNRKALRDYQIEEKLEAGIVLVGSEIKSIREGRASLREAYASVDGGEVWLFDMHVSPYMQASRFGHDPTRARKLLLHKDEIKRLTGRITERGYTLVPVRLYIKDGKAKVELGLARGKRQYDKRREIARKDADREIERAVRHQGRGGTRRME
jgi:SsrA-binding protein